MTLTADRTETALAGRLDAVIDRALAAKRIAGAVILVAEHGAPVYGRAAGFLDREAARPMRLDAIFRFASLSKPLVAATALALIDKGKLRLTDTLADWLPDFRPKLANGSPATITIRHLLTHTAGFAYPTAEPNDAYVAAGVSGGLAEPGLGMAENLRRLAGVPLYFAPGTAWRYGVNIDVLGAVIAKAHDGTLADAVRALVTGPLAMPDTGFAVTDKTRLAVAYADDEPGLVPMRDPHMFTSGLGVGTRFSPSRIFDPASFQSGGAGMAGSGPDFLRFLEALRAGGAPILKPAALEAAGTNQIGDLPREDKDAGWRFGYLSAVLADPAAAKAPQAKGTLQWGGIYGHSWFIDRVAGLSVVALTNTAVEGCLGVFPNEIRDAVYGR